VDLLTEALGRALALIVGLDRELLGVTLLTLRVSATATLLSVVLGVAAGCLLALRRFPGRGVAVVLVNAGMGLPPVVVGLVVAALLWRSGPLGRLELIYTPAAIVAAQTLLALPIVTGITMAAVQQVPPGMYAQALALGATRAQGAWMLVREARLPLLAAVMAGFGGAVSEVGASLMVGGNIRGETRVLTTAIVLETGRGSFAAALALGLVLLLVTLAVTAVLTWAQQGRRP